MTEKLHHNKLMVWVRFINDKPEHTSILDQDLEIPSNVAY